MKRYLAPLALLALLVLPRLAPAEPAHPSFTLLAKATKAKPTTKKVKAKKSGSAWPWVVGLVAFSAAGVGYWKRKELKAYFDRNAPDAVKGLGRELAKKAVSSASKVAGDQVQNAVGDGLGGALAGDATEHVAKKAGHKAIDKRSNEKVAGQAEGRSAPKSTLSPAPLKSKEAVAQAAPAPEAKGHGYPPVHGIDLKTYAKINAERNRRAAFDDASLAKILAPHKLTPAQFLEVEQQWQHRMSDGDQPAERLRAVMDEFNRASAEAMQAA